MKTKGVNRYIDIGPIVEMNKPILLNHRVHESGAFTLNMKN